MSISTVCDDSNEKKQVIFNASDGFVYAREGTSLSVYDGIEMTFHQKCRKNYKTKKSHTRFWNPERKTNNNDTNGNNNNILSFFDEGDDVKTENENGNDNALIIENNSENQGSTSSDDGDDLEDGQIDLNAEDEEEESHSIVYFSDHDSDSEDQDSDSDEGDSDEKSVDDHTMQYMVNRNDDRDSDDDREDSQNMKYVKRPSQMIMDNIENNKNNKNNLKEERRRSFAAIFDYKGGQVANELLFSRNDEIIVDDEKDGGLYLFGYKQDDPDDKGWFPNSYAKEIKQ